MKNTNRSILTGAAFLMATSAIGPGFLTQTAVFTEQLGTSFGFVILVAIVLDIIAQVTIWRVITVSGKPAQDIANAVFPGLGYLLALLVFLGGLVFNIGNVAGAGMGLNVLLGINVSQGAIISAVIAISIFIYKEAGKAMDSFTKFLGLGMILLTCYVTWTSNPPLTEALVGFVLPEEISFTAILTIVGGTVGGYITFAGAHRLLDAGITGKSRLAEVTKSAGSAVGIASVMRILLFLGALGVIATGFTPDPANPTASIFKQASGNFGYKVFGLVMWCAAITSVVGSAYTSVSFIKTFHPLINKKNREIIISFIVLSCALFVIIGKPVKILIIAGALNGLILPVALAIMLYASYRTSIIKDYKQPLWLTIAAFIVIVMMMWMGYHSISSLFPSSHGGGVN